LAGVRLTPSYWRCIFSAAALLVVGAIQAQEGSNPAIEQSRLYPRTIPPTAGSLSVEGISVPDGEGIAPEDESFGVQQILKTQDKIPQFLISAGTSLYFTNNVALTHTGTQSDAFFVGEAGFNWTPRLSPNWQFQLGGAMALFRYEQSALDFESLGAGTGLIFTPPNMWGLIFSSRYDFVELLDRHSNQILQDHEFTLAVQKVLVLGRSHSLSFGIIGSAGISDPVAEQRDQIGLGIAYHLQLSRYFGTDLAYRLSAYFYNEHGRQDVNQVFSLGLHYDFKPWAAVNGYLSGALNHSNESVFKYKVFDGGGGLGLTIRF
jgi:hypothetical protein